MEKYKRDMKDQLINAPLEKKARRIDEPLPLRGISLVSIIKNIEELGNNLPDHLAYKSFVEDLDRLVKKYSRHAAPEYKYWRK